MEGCEVERQPYKKNPGLITCLAGRGIARGLRLLIRHSMVEKSTEVMRDCNSANHCGAIGRQSTMDNYPIAAEAGSSYLLRRRSWSGAPESASHTIHSNPD